MKKSAVLALASGLVLIGGAYALSQSNVTLESLNADRKSTRLNSSH